MVRDYVAFLPGLNRKMGSSDLASSRLVAGCRSAIFGRRKGGFLCQIAYAVGLGCSVRRSASMYDTRNLLVLENNIDHFVLEHLVRFSARNMQQTTRGSLIDDKVSRLESLEL